ncbi:MULTISPECIES: Sjogren's syndrome/scleroderma autoantigen 1 family protein [Halobacterium]|uniref:Sjogren's syndrome/scleroderma autoantigen 1 family protein n=1 Tax=Halobacterium TaxID=2239 RepID=UPI00073EE607|nr:MULTISPECIES: Sjogren's syndrome/scleroderma autoantigen 1 family protein [Halobacterium]MCG1004497.1 hypothetical protein [Halobacterium noricense]
MSDTDDGFDEEAVREELREKYDDDDRGETERMSELLLQGATMTNKHCDRCGNPIFRYEGQSFCPNCQQSGGEQQAASQPADTRAQAEAQPAEGQQSADRQSADGQPADQQSAGRQPSRSVERQQSAQPTREQPPAQPATPEQSPADSQQPPAGTEPASPTQSGEGADALDASIAALARRAAGADDPRRAREFLEAAREGAEALDALRRNS